MLSMAESCTGGLLAAALTEVPGASAVVERGFVTYTNAAKEQMLGVSADTLRLYGAVSPQVAQEQLFTSTKLELFALSMRLTATKVTLTIWSCVMATKS